MIFALGMLEDDIFQAPDFFSEDVELGEEDFFLFCFIAETALDLLVLSLLALATFVGGNAVALEVLGPLGANVWRGYGFHGHAGYTMLWGSLCFWMYWGDLI